jgi:hypothetical protein
MEKKKKDKRFRTRAYCDVCDQSDNRSLGCLVDLSQGGLKLLGEKQLNEGELYQLSIVMHKEINGSRTLDVNAKCLWTREGFHPGTYYAGFQFEAIDKQTLKRVVLFTRSSAFHYPSTQKVKVK